MQASKPHSATPSTPTRRRVLAAGAALPVAAVAAGLASPAAAAFPVHGRPDRRPPAAPTFGEVSVHDPSIIQVGGTSYVFGSHLAAARTDDLMTWTSVADGVTPDNPLFDDVTTQLSEALTWAGADTLWAPDVHATADGRFRMYYCACEGSSPRSALGSAIADSVEGPYEDEGIFLRSGMWDEPSEDGEIYDAYVHPNVVDPQAFEDADGRSRLVYGSYSGGIFLLEVDPATGRPLPGQGYGVHLIGGNHARIEAPYILYSPRARYYYLFVTFGGLDASGGYNVRVGRSRRVEGPYVDSEGNDLSECKADKDLPLFDDASIEPYGVKLMGGHEWAFGGAGEGENAFGYVSPGHMSAWHDKARGGALMVFHTRFPGRGEEHEVRVHRLHLTRDGWPVLSPLRFGGEAPKGRHETRVLRSQVKGTWEIIDHGHDITAESKPSRTFQLRADGRITESGGAKAGRWRLAGGSDMVIELATERFTGILTRGWNSVTKEWTPELSALSRDGRALWGVRV